MAFYDGWMSRLGKPCGYYMLQSLFVRHGNEDAFHPPIFLFRSLFLARFATKLQGRALRFLTRRRVVNRSAATLTAQRLVRGTLVRIKVKGLLEAARRERRRIFATVIIASWWRGRIVRLL